MCIVRDCWCAKSDNGMIRTGALATRLTIVSIMFLLTACSNIQPERIAGKSDVELIDTANKVWSDQLKTCQASLDKLDQQSLSSNKAKLAIAVLGTLSGSVFSQLAKGSGKDAWSGLSGSANALQTALDKSFSANLMLSEALAIATAIVKVNARFIEESDPGKKLQIAYSLPMACRLARLTAIEAANRAVSQGNIDVQEKVIRMLK